MAQWLLRSKVSLRFLPHHPITAILIWFLIFFFPPLTAALIAAAILSQKQKSMADLECECETFSAAKS